jgi:hypothetical protein
MISLVFCYGVIEEFGWGDKHGMGIGTQRIAMKACVGINLVADARRSSRHSDRR